MKNNISRFLNNSILLFSLLFFSNNWMNAQCIISVDTICAGTITMDTLLIDSVLNATSYTWYTNNGATINVQTGDTSVIADWSTSTIVDGNDTICVEIANTCMADTFCLEVYLEDCCPEPPLLIIKRVGAQTLCEFLTANPTDPIGSEDCDGGGIDNLTECQNSLDPEDPDDDCIVPVGAEIGVYSLSIQNGENETPVLPIVTYLEKDPNGTTDASTWVFSGAANFAYTSGVQGQGQTNFTDGAFHYNVLNGNMSHGLPFEIQSAHFFSGGTGALTDKEGSQLTRVKSSTGGAATACGVCPTDLTLNVAAKGAALAGIVVTGTSFYYTIDGGAAIPITTFVPPAVNEVPQDITFICPGAGVCQEIEFVQETTYEYTGGTAVNPSPVITYQKVELCWGK